MWTCSLPMMPAIDDRLTIDPPPLAIMARTAKLTEFTEAIVVLRTGKIRTSFVVR
jgi:hypothetical protein